MENKFALITGASSGIGLEISKVLAKKGHNLILIARSKQKLEEVCEELSNNHNIKCDYFSSDLTLIDSPDKIYDFTSQKK